MSVGSVDVTEAIRRERQAELNTDAGARAELEAKHGKVWNTEELSTEFTASGFMAPYVVVRRKSDGIIGTLEFQHSPRFYFNFQEDKR